MTLHPIDYSLWEGSCIIEAFVVCAIFKNGVARRWPFMLALVLFDILQSVLIVTHLEWSGWNLRVSQAYYPAYFHIYWYGYGIRSFLMLGLLWDVFRTLPALKYVPRNIGLVLLSAGLTVTIGSVFLTTLHHPNTAYKITYEVLLIRECVTVLWVCCAGALLGSISFLGLGWSLESVNITSGFLASGIAAMIAASLTSSWPHHGHMFDRLQTCIEIAVFLSWIKTLCHTPLPDVFLSDSALNAVKRAITELSSHECIKHVPSLGTLGPRPRVD